MIYLLDVNALVALGLLQHELHRQVATWTQGLASAGSMEFATCSITELGFVRVLAQAPQYNFSVSQARDLLAQLKASNVAGFKFITDDLDVSRLPAWVKTPKQITDGHLSQLAKAKGAILATLDKGIPHAFRIPPDK